jgi:hypothetical protein
MVVERSFGSLVLSMESSVGDALGSFEETAVRGGLGISGS